jgi:hypothetical protein
MSADQTLPPLPEPAHDDGGDLYGRPRTDYFTASQMRDYARAAILSERERALKDAGRYRWLRDKLRKTRRPLDAPYVIHPRSRLYAVRDMRGPELDAAIDEDILQDMTQHVFEEALAEGDARFADPEFKFSDEFEAECTEKARAVLAAGAYPPSPGSARGTDAQILKERELTASAISGAYAFGQGGRNPPPEGHWLVPFWLLGHDSQVEILRLRSALKMVVDHWNEFGPEHGLDEKMEYAARAARGSAPAVPGSNSQQADSAQAAARTVPGDAPATPSAPSPAL